MYSVHITMMRSGMVASVARNPSPCSMRQAENSPCKDSLLGQIWPVWNVGPPAHSTARRDDPSDDAHDWEQFCFAMVKPTSKRLDILATKHDISQAKVRCRWTSFTAIIINFVVCSCSSGKDALFARRAHSFLGSGCFVLYPPLQAVHCLVWVMYMYMYMYCWW